MKNACATLLLYLALPEVHSAEALHFYEAETPGVPLALRQLVPGNGGWWGWVEESSTNAFGRHWSVDGLNWVRTSDNHNSSVPVFGRGEFYIFDGQTLIASTNGASNFRAMSVPYAAMPYVAGESYGFTFGNDRFHIIRAQNNTSLVLATSREGAQWDFSVLPAMMGNPRALLAAHEVVLISTTAGYLYTSADLKNWTVHPGRLSLSVITSTPAGFLGVEHVRNEDTSLSFRLYYSPDGYSWKVVQERGGYPSGITFGDGVAVVWGYDVLGQVSATGTDWQAVTRSGLRPISTLVYGNRKFLGALHPTGLISSEPLATPRFLGVRRAAGRIVLELAGQDGFVLEQTSRLDGAWMPVPAPVWQGNLVEFADEGANSLFFRLRFVSAN